MKFCLLWMGVVSWMTAVSFAQTPGGYVGSQACFACHSTIFRSYAKTGMGRSMRPASALQPPALPVEASVPLPGSARVLKVLYDGKTWRQTESEPGTFETGHDLAFAIGSGVNGLSFLVQRGDFLFQAPLSFYSRSAKWDLSPGYEQLDLGFNRLVPQECIGCHTGRANLATTRSGAYNNPPFAELAIGCENCHGPGERHVKAGGKTRGLIVNPAALPPRLAESICVNCHQTGDSRVLQAGKSYQDFRPGQWLFDTAVIIKASERLKDQRTDLLEHYTSMRASRCFRQSQGKLSCLSCHDPHVEPTAAESPAYFKSRCLTCHSEESCPLPRKVRDARTPADDCAGCHMPKRDSTQIAHSALTNHRIPARAGETISEAVLPEENGLIVVNAREGKSQSMPALVRLKAYRDLSYRDPAYRQRYLETLDRLAKETPSDPFVQAALGHKSLSEGQPEAALDHLLKAVSLNESAVFLDLGETLSKLGRPADAIEYLKKGVEAEPFNATIQKTLILQYINNRRYADAKQSMELYVASFPEDSFMRGLLNRVK